MQTILVLAGITAFIWGIWKLSEPWRKYHEKHIAPLEGQLKSAEARFSEKDRELRDVAANANLFSRDFRAEIQRHQAAKSAAYEQLNPLNERKSQLHDELNGVRSRLDSWHRSSKSFFGNKGQKIKDDSVLGWFGLEQTVAQKESLERRRASLSSEIADLKEQASKIFEAQIKPSKDGIKAAYDDQKRLEAFRRSGQNRDFFRAKMATLTVELSEVEAEISRLKQAISAATEGYKRSSG